MSFIKQVLRNLYYKLSQGKLVTIESPASLNGKKWIIDRNYGRAYFKGYYEPAITKFIEQYLKPGSCFLDIGAHAGYFSLIASSICRKGKVYSFEPDPYNFSFLKKIKEINLNENWVIENQAVGASEAELKFKKGISSSTGMIADDGDISVAVTSLDKYFKTAISVSIDMLKIDVEGFGGEVLIGAQEIINRYKPVILFENHKGTAEQKIVSELLSGTYSFTDMKTGEPVDMNNTYSEFIILRPNSVQA